MMRAARWLWLMVIATGGAAFADPPRIEFPQGVPPALVERVRAYDAAVRGHDRAALQDLWTEDYVFVDPRGLRTTKKERLEHLESGATALHVVGVETEGVASYGDTVLTITRIHLTGKYAGKAIGGEHRMISVWVNQQGRWRLAANQLTPILATVKPQK
jgi:ketosteroid isomerase-like protein